MTVAAHQTGTADFSFTATTNPRHRDLVHRPRRMTFVDDLLVLTKVRLNALVVVTTAAGYYMAVYGPLDVIAARSPASAPRSSRAGAAAINQVSERDLDALMERTRQSPGRRRPDVSVAEGCASSASRSGVVGLGALWFGVESAPPRRSRSRRSSSTS